MTAAHALIESALPLVAVVARKVKVPPGLTVEDLESVGNESLVESAAEYDPGAGVPFKPYARQRMKWAMMHACRKQRDRSARPLQLEFDGEAMPPPADPKAGDPTEIAAAREPLAHPRRQRCRLARTLPAPDQVADQVAALRAAMFGAVAAEDMAEVMQGVVARAKDGSAKDVKLLLDLLAPARSGVMQVVNQQAVVIQQGDLT